jgi:dGTPase
LKNRYKRHYRNDIPSNPDEVRAEARRDRDRILYSVEFQRLAGVTQVASPTERFPVHNRLTHSLKVSQVGRAIAEELLHRNPQSGLENDVNPDVVEAACLAHDLGHPPFGHNTERELDSLLWDADHPAQSLYDGFEGNAQSFRVVTKTAVKYQEDERSPGLNLTAATLNAILKYPVTQDDPNHRHSKWGYYVSEQGDFNFARERTGTTALDGRSLEAEIMNTADDITYAVHDVEDFFRAGLLPLDSVASDSAERDWFLSCSTLSDRAAVADFLDGLSLQRYQGRHTHLAQLAEFRSSTVNRFITGIDIEFTAGGPVLQIADHVEFEISVLKELTRIYVIESPAIQSQRYGQRRIIRTLFEIFYEEATKKARTPEIRLRHLQIFPPLFQDRIKRHDPTDRLPIMRLIADLIASMAEQHAIETFAKLTGQNQGSVIDRIG